MPLNRVVGETLAGMKSPPVVMSLEKWQDTKFWEMAAEHADKAFGLASSKTKSFRRRVRAVVKPFLWTTQDVLVQVYPYEVVPRIVFIFHKVINGKELYHPVPFDLSPGIVHQLRMAGRWPAKIDVAA